ncbi:MAG TPA: MMPL family transporter [Candidatus Limnocylindrales bacterium]|nr:MMPL family transporter [Candidatus Limnocylindrales bacterium]
MSSPFERLGRWSARHRRLVIAAWALLLLGAAPLAFQTSGALRTGGFIRSDLESARAKALLETEIHVPQAAVVVVFHSDTLRAGDPAFEAPAGAAIADIPKAPYVTGILSHLLETRQVSADGHTAYDVVFLGLSADDSPRALPGIRAALRTDVPGLEVGLAGGPAFYGDVQDVSESDLRRSELISLPLAALALLIVFGSVVAASLPLAVGGAAVVTALAGIFLVANVLPMSIFVLNLATLLGLGLGVDYSLLMTSRFREELAARGRRPEAVEDAIAATVATAGRAVFFSGVTVLLGLLGLVLFEFMILRSVGIAGAIVVGLAVSAALTLLPALFALVGVRLDALRIRRVAATPSGEGPWARLAEWVMARPVAVLVPTLAVLVLLGAPFLHVRFNAPDFRILPENVASREWYDRLEAAFGPGPFAPIVLAIRTQGDATTPANVAALYDYSRRLGADSRVERVDSLVDVDPRLDLAQYQLLYASPGGPPDRFVQEALRATTAGSLTDFTITTWYGPNDEPGRQLVRDLRSSTGPLAPPPGMTVLVGGGAADVEDVVGGIGADFPRTALFILVTTYAVLFLLLRSVVLPIKAVVMNSLSILASFGALVWIFQDGNLSTILGTRPLGFVETTQPVILFCVLFGLSMDYEVFLLTRMRESWDADHDNRAAVAHGLERSGRIVTSAALIVVVVAGSFALADIVLIKALGLGIAIAVALDATVVRALLVPATMRLLGKWNWWLPDNLARRLKTLAAAALSVVVLGGCTGGPILANPPLVAHNPPSPSPAASRPADPQPVVLPRDDGPHDRLTEWWYLTGHLATADGRHFGFEAVIFRAERGAAPVTWASHLALTDESGRRFLVGQRTAIGSQPDQSPRDASGQPTGFDLAIGTPPVEPGASTPDSNTWRLSGSGQEAAIDAALTSGEAQAAGGGFGLQLRLESSKPAVLHDRDGWIDFGPAGGSYYYSRTRMAVTGSLAVGPVTNGASGVHVTGEAWFDHQWGDFISVGGGGWDWFAVNLDDGTDLTLSLVRSADGSLPLVYGTLVDASGRATHLDRDAFTVTTTGSWTSPATGATYPSGWRIEVPSQALAITLTPTIPDQELDTRPTTGVVYWEGSQVVQASRAGAALGGEAYVELTGYAR